jgi:hypothetical protein
MKVVARQTRCCRPGVRLTTGAPTFPESPTNCSFRIALHVNVIRQSGYLAEAHRSSVDLAVTYAIRLH